MQRGAYALAASLLIVAFLVPPAVAAPVPLRLTVTLARSGTFFHGTFIYVGGGGDPSSEEIAQGDFAWFTRFRFPDLPLTGLPGHARVSRPAHASAGAMGFDSTGYVQDKAVCPQGCGQCAAAILQPEPWRPSARLVAEPDRLAITIAVLGVGVSQRLSQTPCGAGSGAPEDGTVFFSGGYVFRYDGGRDLPGANHSLTFAVPRPERAFAACQRALGAGQTQPPACVIRARLPIEDDFVTKDHTPNGDTTASHDTSSSDAEIIVRMEPAKSSGGSAACVVPGLVGRSFDDALPLLVAAGCTVGRVTYVRDSDRGPGAILKQSPSAGQHAAPDQRVSLTVSAPR